MTARRFTDRQLVIASHNAGKVREIGDLLVPLGIAVNAAGDLNLPEPEETGTTYTANAALKARAAADATGLPALADDSGFAVAALGGAPGVYSARWAGPGKDFAIAMARVWDEVTALDRANAPADRAAAFICALALAWPDGHIEVFEGSVTGQMVWPPRGSRGFGYDPMFQAAGMTETFGECDPAFKHTISHRAVAFKAMLNACFSVDD